MIAVVDDLTIGVKAYRAWKARCVDRESRPFTDSDLGWQTTLAGVDPVKVPAFLNLKVATYPRCAADGQSFDTGHQLKLHERIGIKVEKIVLAVFDIGALLRLGNGRRGALAPAGKPEWQTKKQGLSSHGRNVVAAAIAWKRRLGFLRSGLGTATALLKCGHVHLGCAPPRASDSLVAKAMGGAFGALRWFAGA